MKSEQSQVLLGAVAGAIGGVVGTWAMATCQSLWTRAAARAKGGKSMSISRRLVHAGVGAGKMPQSEPRSHEKPISSSEQLVRRGFHAVRAGEPTKREREYIGSAFHFAFGASVGAMYGAAAEKWRPITAGGGIAYAMGVWLIADEIGVPALGIADPPWKTPVRLHVYSIASHVAFGVGLEWGRRISRSVN